ncbi:hypothetical protein LTR56_003214 [Elasticomyces elasticus]|nr:hypothetical protein LTR22_010747 [Elasticomyces elasticus]KAK3656082.1 hypothetical protein LTR56_003214 [Elasticomyces elasticus]KAK4920854.1 hypothetical protein LTR49_011576 [Elasticomyces elasticus]KAK5759628.1 hypothetical protein LTS12_010321 [Elasticomyces elasticus]
MHQQPQATGPTMLISQHFSRFGMAYTPPRRRVVATEKQMLLAYAELAEGEEALTTAWIEYKLGVSLRRPFCTAERMGRFELLSSSGGLRGNWGPW